MLLTKLHIPTSGTNLVQRPNLFEKLNEGLKRKLTLVSASAGFGKTTVVSDWINKNKIPAAWFSIDSNDNDMVDFISYIISGIQTLDKKFSINALKLLKSPTPPGAESIINLLINDIIDIKKDFVLVLDDFHLISNQEILKAISYLVEYMPENLHVTILSRSDPNLPIARLRSQQQLIELRSTDLSFTANDIAILFNKKLKTKLSVDDIQSLETKTEGWIAGLQLAALSLQGHGNTSAFISAFAGNNRYIMDYLIEEVLRIQSEDLKEFMLKTSLLEQFSAPLCNAVLNRTDSQLIIEELENNNMFVFPLDAERHWYRYHHLFADLLKQRLLHYNKPAIEELHNRACNWFEQNHMYDFAIEHALAINNYEKCIGLLGTVAEDMWQNGLHTALMKYGDILPDVLIKKNPEFCFYYSWILISSGQIRKAEPFLASAEKITRNIIQKQNTSSRNLSYYKKLLGKISVGFAYLNSHEEQSDKTFEYCKTAMEYLTEDDPLWFSGAWFSYGVSYLSAGKLIESKDAFNKAFEYAKRSGNIYLISTIVIRLAENEQQLGEYKKAYKRCADLLNLINEKGYSPITKAEWTYAALYFIMGITEFAWAKFDEAFEKIKIAYTLSKEGKDFFLRIFILMVYSFVLKELGDSELENTTRELDEIMKQGEVPVFFKSMYIGWQVYMLLEKNQLDEAHEVITNYGLNINSEKTPNNEALFVVYARLLVMKNQLDEAKPIIDDLYKLAVTGKKTERLIECQILYAFFHKTSGNMDQAVTSLLQAMHIASKEELVSYFIFNLGSIDDVLTEAFKRHTTTKTNIPDAYIGNIKQAIEKRKKLKKEHIEIELSPRELDTLKLISKDLTNQDIADQLFISLNTVKTHVKNILLKLEVDNRSKAVSKAKELGII